MKNKDENIKVLLVSEEKIYSPDSYLLITKSEEKEDTSLMIGKNINPEYIDAIITALKNYKEYIKIEEKNNKINKNLC